MLGEKVKNHIIKKQMINMKMEFGYAQNVEQLLGFSDSNLLRVAMQSADTVQIAD